MNVFLVLDVSRFMLLLLCCDYEGEREPKPAVFVDLRLRTSILRLRPAACVVRIDREPPPHAAALLSVHDPLTTLTMHVKTNRI